MNNKQLENWGPVKQLPPIGGKPECKVEARQVYGKELYYPANDRAEIFLRLTGKKTFDKYELKIIQEVGYNVIFTTKTMEDL
jgi:hypothetical protein